MTCLDVLRKKFPDWTEDMINATVTRDCPHSYGIMGDPVWCLEEDGNNRCERCWGRNVSEEPSTSDKQYNPIQKAYDLMVGFCHEGKTTNLEEVIGYLGEALDDHSEDSIEAKFAIATPIEDEGCEPHIKDSGNRTQFESGAVRDMREGKGRFDLAPLEVMAIVLDTGDLVMDPIVYDISVFMNTKDTARLRAALRNFAEKAYDGSIPSMFLDAAKHYEAGAKKYGPDNWRKSIPTWCYIDSGVRHYMKWLRGDNDEPHAAALVWNLLCCIWEVDWGEEWRATYKKEQPK